jgi:hypothetical protein
MRRATRSRRERTRAAIAPGSTRIARIASGTT